MLVNLDVALHQVQFNRHWLVALMLTLVLGGQVVVGADAEPREPVYAAAGAGVVARAEYRAGGLVAVPYVHAAV